MNDESEVEIYRQPSPTVRGYCSLAKVCLSILCEGHLTFKRAKMKKYMYLFHDQLLEQRNALKTIEVAEKKILICATVGWSIPLPYHYAKNAHSAIVKHFTKSKYTCNYLLNTCALYSRVLTWKS